MTDRLPSLQELYAYGEELLVVWDAPDLEGSWRLQYNARMRTRAGVAYLAARRIELNPKLLARHPARVRECLCHELAHLVVHVQHGSRARAHGSEWAALMEAAGFDASRTHDFDVTGLRRSRRRYVYLHQCVQCEAHWLARRIRRDLVCASCGPGEVRVLRAADGRGAREALLTHAGIMDDTETRT